MSEMTFRHPSLNDGAEVFQLIKDCPPLDVNSQYYYHIICDDFSETSVVAELDHQIVGFISGYLKPKKTDHLFIWQVAVSEKARGKKLASNMLEWLTKQSRCNDINVLETTISPSNLASQNLFLRFAETHNASVETSTYLDASHFGSDPNSHEDEVLYQISPLLTK
jgi:diaminobutyrate acetyltransferase